MDRLRSELLPSCQTEQEDGHRQQERNENSHAVADPCSEDRPGPPGDARITPQLWRGGTAPRLVRSRSSARGDLADAGPIAFNRPGPPSLPASSLMPSRLWGACPPLLLFRAMLEESMLSAHDLAALQTLPEVATIECHDTLGSTMDRGRELAGDGSVALPALVLATRQQAGRGRRGASWWQPPGSLAMTLVLESGASAATGPLPLWAPACGLAVVETVHALLPTLSPAVRWPNDIELHGRKLAGILVE